MKPGILEQIRKAHPDLYKSEWYEDRYQVSNFAYGKEWYTIFDKETMDFIKGPDGLCHYFHGQKAAENHLFNKILSKKKSSAKKKVVVQTDQQFKSAAAMFRALIQAGDLSDDEIFGQVQEAFDLPDNRRSYVEWYRKDLKKKGLL